MLWLKHINKPLNKSNNIKKETQEISAHESDKLDFKISLKQSANLEIDNGSGYGIAKMRKLKDMI